MIGLRGRPRRDPYPYMIQIAGNGYMLADDEKGNVMVSTRPPNQDDVVPTDYGADASNPSFGRWQQYADFGLGFGKEIQALVQDRKSYRAIGVDTSQSYKIIMGPEVLRYTPSPADATATGGWMDFFEIGGALYGVSGQYCYKRLSDNNFALASGKDFGGGNQALRGTAVFTNNATGVQYAFVPMAGATKAYYYDGATWAQFPTFTALCFCQVGREFYRASDTNLVSKVSTNADPLIEANWTAPNQFRVGDKSSSIVRMWTDINGTLLILKTDGIYSLSATGQDIPYFAKLLKQGTGTDNGKVVWSFENNTMLMYNGVTYTLGPDFKLTPIGPELAPGNDSELTGYISAGLGHQTFNAYGMLVNPDTSTSYLMKWRTYTNTSYGLGGSQFPTATASPQDVWVGSISQPFTSVKGTVMWESTIGASSGHSRAWIGFSDGSYAVFTLPCSQDPSGCTQYRFSTVQGTLDPPYFTGTFQGNNKVIMQAKVTGTRLSSTQYVEIGYKTDPDDAAFTDWGAHFSDNGQRAELPDAVAGALLPFRFTFTNDVATSSPVVNAIEILWALQYDDLRQVYVLEVLCEDGLVAQDGRPFRRTGPDMRAALKAAGTAASGMTVLLPDEDAKILRLIKYGERTVLGGRARRWQKTVHLEAAEVNTEQIYGTIGRLAAYTVGDLAGFTVGGLEGV